MTEHKEAVGGLERVIQQVFIKPGAAVRVTAQLLVSAEPCEKK